MCKLAAYINFDKLTLAEEKSINTMLDHLFYINSFGQTDGSGVMLMDSTGNFDMHKRALPSPDFMNTKWYKSQDFASKMFVGFHTRYSTVGGNSDKNSHPFVHGKIALMQNGTISGSHKGIVRGKVSPCDVDSDSVCWAFNEQGIEKTLNDDYRGAGVFMFFNLEEKSFNIIKNDERTLHFLKVRDKNTVIVATDAHALALAATRAKVPFDKVEEVKIDHWHKWGIDKTYSSEPMEIKKGFSWGDEYSNFKYPNHNHQQNQRHNVPRSEAKSDRGNNLVVPISKKKDTTMPVTIEETGEYMSDCVWCSSPIYTDADSIGYSETTKECCCAECLPTVEQYYGKEEWRLKYAYS